MSIEKPDLHKIAVERQELRNDLLERSGKSWAEQKKTWKKEEGFSGVAEAIESGNILEFLSGEEELGVINDPDAHIKNRLVELDERAKNFSLKNKEQVSGVREARTVETEKRQNDPFEKISREIFALEKIEEANLRAEFNIARRSKGKFSEGDKKQLMEISKIQAMIEKRRSALRENPKTCQFFRMHELKHASAELSEFGFASMESQKEDMEWIRKRWSEGSAVLLEGPTGTGKTELLNYMARKLYRTTPEVLRCTERTGPAEIFGKTLLRAKGEGTETFFQPGRYTTAIDRGVPLLMDEFNQLPTNMRFAFKELYNRKPGEEIRVQEDSGVTHMIKEGFAWAATANIKSGKHKERFDLDGAESRVFDMRHIGYMPKDELYDLSLASLMDKKGGVHLSGREADTTLKFLVEAAEEIQSGYADELQNHYGMSTGRGKKPSLEKAVLDPGKVLRIVAGYKIEALKGVSFQDYLDERMMDFVSKGDYPEKDRELMVRILASKGFFQDIPAKDFSLKGLTEPILNSLRGAKMEKDGVDEEKYLTLEQLAALDPFGKRAELFSNLGSEFLEDGGKEKLLSEIEKIKQKIAQSGKVPDDFFEQPSQPSLLAIWQDPETGVEKPIEINLEEKISESRKFYKDKFNLEIDETEIRNIWVKNYAEIKSEVEKYGYDEILIIPENLPGEAQVNQKAIETMDEGVGKGKVAATKYWIEQSSIVSVSENKYKIILVHAAQNLADQPLLKATKGKNIMALSGLDKAEVERRIAVGQELPVDFKIEISGQEIEIKAGGLSLEEYEIFQRMYFEKTGKHLDEDGWTWLMKSRSDSRVVGAGWAPDGRRLDVAARGPGDANGDLGLRLSRSFSN